MAEQLAQQVSEAARKRGRVGHVGKGGKKAKRGQKGPKGGDEVGPLRESGNGDDAGTSEDTPNATVA